MHANHLNGTLQSAYVHTMQSARRPMYHATSAPPKEVLAHGIDWRRGDRVYGADGYEHLPQGNYLWPTVHAARLWAEQRDLDFIYLVETGGLPLKRDPFWDDLPENDIDYIEWIGPRGGRPRAFYSAQPIDACRVELLEQAQAVAA